MMKDHIYDPGKTKIDENTWFCKISSSICCGGLNPHGTNKEYQTTLNGIYKNSCVYCLYYNTGIVINNVPHKECVYGTKEELENWKYFAFNNKLPLFLNIILTIDQHNNSYNYVPWITDKHYTDDEIYKILNISHEEKELVDKTILKFERNSEWFKKYMEGL